MIIKGALFQSYVGVPEGTYHVSFVLPGLSRDLPNQLMNHCLPKGNKLEYVRTDVRVMVANPKQTFWFNWVTTHIRMFACVFNTHKVLVSDIYVHYDYINIDILICN